MFLLSLLSELANELVPEPCLRCHALAGPGFCADCVAEFERIGSPCRCGLPLPCTACPASDNFWVVATVLAPFAYSGVLAQIIQALKYRGRRRTGDALGRVLASEFVATTERWDCVVPVPLHRQRLRERSFNQASEIALPLARHLGLPLAGTAVHRKARTPPQTGQSRRDRLQSLTNAFQPNRDFSGLRVLIVDDVITTGATANALATAMLAAGASRVDACAIARAKAVPRTQPSRKI